MAQPHATQDRLTRWSLEVVRGRDVGRVFEVVGSEVELGNGLDGGGGLDLREQEAGSARRMAARQASLEAKGPDLIIRDLESPGGTFVNRQRLLAGQARRLQPGDEIQLGSVQLRVVGHGAPVTGSPTRDTSNPRTGGTPPPLAPRAAPAAVAVRSAGGVAGNAATAGRLPVPYAIAGTISCRTWDDFLVVAAQRWNDLRDELASGRLAEFLRRIQRTDLLPPPDGNRSLDNRLDEWLARLPVSMSSAPELDVHPASLEVPAAVGGVTRHVLRITNVGYRLLRCTARVEPAGASWVRLGPNHDGRPFDTVEQTELPVEVVVPEFVGGPLAAEIVVESNGGTRRIAVRIARSEGPPPFPDVAVATSAPSVSGLFRSLAAVIAGYPATARIVVGIVGAIAFRMLVVGSSLLPVGGRGLPPIEPRLPALAVLFAVLGVLVGVLKGRGRGEGQPFDRLAAGIAAGLFGIMAAAVAHAVVHVAERVLGPWASTYLAVGLLWAAIGAAVAGITCLLIPYREPSTEATS
jgi:hypothetical protein